LLASNLDGGDDEIVPDAGSAPLSAKFVKDAVVTADGRYSHGVATRNADAINEDLLAVFEGEHAVSA